MNKKLSTTNNNRPKISVIVAVYLAENYIRRCLDSILGQTFTDFEVLMIDDGSPDGSGEICKEYARKDNRFRYILKEHSGVSMTRQCGIDNAGGVYSIHIDPDDWIEPNMFELMHTEIIKTNSDMCVCQEFIEKGINNPANSATKYSEKSLAKFKENRIYNLIHTLGGGLCNKLIKHKLYSEFKIKFIDNMITGEDTLVLIKLFINRLKICLVNKRLYHYDKIVNPNSITRNNNSIRCCVECLILMKNNISNNFIFNEYFAIRLGDWANQAFLLNCFSSKEYRDYFGGYLIPLLKSKNPLRRKINVILALSGLGNLFRPFYLNLKSFILNYHKENNTKTI